jgi:hypothetical protein
MGVIVPVRQDLIEWVQRTRLDGLLYVLRFKWNARDQSWIVDILDESEAPIRTGIKIVEGFPLLRTIAVAGRPPGELAAIDPTGRDMEAAQETLGVDVLLAYLDAAELGR